MPCQRRVQSGPKPRAGAPLCSPSKGGVGSAVLFLVDGVDVSEVLPLPLALPR